MKRQTQRQEWEGGVQFGTYEIDWLAVDKKGQLAMFTALLEAPIPALAKQSYDLFLAFWKLIEDLPVMTTPIMVSPGSEKAEDWKPYAAQGLFVFDFQDCHRKTNEKRGVYDLIFQPSRPLHLHELERYPFAFSGNLSNLIPRLEVDFANGDVPLNLIR